MTTYDNTTYNVNRVNQTSVAGSINNFPHNKRYLQQQGPSGQETMDMMELKRHGKDLDANTKALMIPKFPTLAILDTMSKGQTINDDVHHWRDKYTNNNATMFVSIDELRSKSLTFRNLGDTGEFGGKLEWQEVGIGTSNNPLTMDKTLLSVFSVPGDIATPYTHLHFSAATRNDNTGAMAGEMKELPITPIPYTFDGVTETKNCLVYGFNRSSSVILGKVDTPIQEYLRTLAANGYILTESLGTNANRVTPICTNGGSTAAVTHWVNLTYKKGTSKRVFAMWDCMYSKEGSAMSQKIQVTTAVQQFWFSVDMNAFFIVYDLAEGNLDYLSTPELQTPEVALVASTWYCLLAGSVELNAGPNTVGFTIAGIAAGTYGTIFQTPATPLWRPTSGAKVYSLPHTYLAEEVNTASFSQLTTRRFAPATATIAREGWSRMAVYLMLNLFNDVPDGVASSEGFDLTDVAGNYPNNGKDLINNMQYFRSKVWGYETIREGQTMEDEDTMYRDKLIHVEGYYKQVSNAIMFGKANRSHVTSGVYPSALAGSYNGEMSGLLDYESYHIPFIRLPFTMYGGTVSDGGVRLKAWMDKLSAALNYNKAPGIYEGHTIPCSRVVLDALGIETAWNQSNSAQYNVWGASIVKNAPTDNALGLGSTEYRSPYGVLRFIHDPSMDIAPAFPVPKFLIPEGYFNPRFMFLAFNKNHIRTLSHAKRPDRVYADLQPTNNPFVKYEGMAGSRTLEVRFPREHMIVDIRPR